MVLQYYMPLTDISETVIVVEYTSCSTLCEGL